VARGLLWLGAVKWTRTLALAALFSVRALSAHAQTDAKFALGYQVGLRSAIDEEAHGGLVSSFLWRFGTSDPGWGFHWGLSWFSTHIDRSVVGESVQLGELHVRPIMAGYGYTYNIGRYSITADVLGGFALTSIELTPMANDAYRNIGARTITTDVSMTPVVKPEVSVWYDINKKFGLNVNAGFMFARPNVSIRSTLGDDARRVRADTLQIKAGLAYTLF
jgi:hypothetical protein